MTTMTGTRARKRPADTLSLRMISVRHDEHLTQRQAALRCGVPFGVWQGMENGRETRNLGQWIGAISDELGYDREWLMWGGSLSDPNSPDGGPLTNP